MELVLQRLAGTTAQRTCGHLLLEGQKLCDTLEDAVREQPGEPVASWKVQDETAIPVGHYRIRLTHSPRMGKTTPELRNVPGFTAIRIHAGNTERDSRGCILVGEATSTGILRNSRIAFTSLMTRLSATAEPIWLTICAAPIHGSVLPPK